MKKKLVRFGILSLPAMALSARLWLYLIGLMPSPGEDRGFGIFFFSLVNYVVAGFISFGILENE